MTTATAERAGTNGSAIFDKLESNELVHALPLTKLKPAKDNPRRKIGDVTELARTMKTLGVLEPLVVCPTGDVFTIVCGHRRYFGAKEAGLDAVPVVVRNYTDRERREAMLVENLQREDLTPLEEAATYKGLLELGATQRELADRLGVSQPVISKRLALLDLPAKAQKELDSGGITLEDALHLTKLKDVPHRIQRALTEGKRYGSIERVVKEELREEEREKKKVAVSTQLQKDGIKIVVWPERTSWFGRKERPLRNGARSSRYSYRVHHDVVDLTVKQHAKEPCHAATIDPDGDAIYLCTDPSHHAKKGKGSKPQVNEVERRARARRREHLKTLREANAGRLEFIKKVLSKRVSQADALEQLTIEMTSADSAPETRRFLRACELLGIDPRARVNSFYEYREAIAKHFVKTGDTATVALAIALASVEGSIQEGSWHNRERIRKHFDFLETKGYETGAAERLEISGKAPR